jgi:hypothetical protein
VGALEGAKSAPRDVAAFGVTGPDTDRGDDGGGGWAAM